MYYYHVLQCIIIGIIGFNIFLQILQLEMEVARFEKDSCQQNEELSSLKARLFSTLTFCT